jgi:hypothetical protein
MGQAARGNWTGGTRGTCLTAVVDGAGGVLVAGPTVLVGRGGRQCASRGRMRAWGRSSGQVGDKACFF